MENLLEKIDEVLLMGPGPSCTAPQVYRALARPTLGHLDPYFMRIMDAIKARLQELLRARTSKVPNWYLDVSLIANYWEVHKRAYHHTAPINMLYALYQGLLLVLEEGQEAVFARHRRVHEELVAGLESLGLELIVEPPHRLPMLNAVSVPAAVDDAQGRAQLREQFKIEVGAGLGPLAGKIWRIGLMGHTAGSENVQRLLAALRQMLPRR